MANINITCDTCHKTHEVPRTDEIPDYVISLGCNWCPNCEDTAKEHYTEWYNGSDGDGDSKQPDPIPDNQLCIPFAMDEILNGIVDVSNEKVKA